MLTIKDVNAFKGHDQKAFIKEAETVGANAAKGTVYGKMVSIAIAAGRWAKSEGLKSYSFDRAGEAFAAAYFGDKTDKTAAAMVTSLNHFTKAGMNTAWDATQTAIDCYNAKAKDDATLSFTSRASMLNRLLKLDHAPSKVEFNKERPAGGNRSGEGTIKGASAALLRSVDGFGVKWLAKLDEPGKAAFATIRKSVEAFAQMYDTAEPAKPTKGGKKGAEPTFADKRKAMIAQLATMQTGKGHKTIN